MNSVIERLAPLLTEPAVILGKSTVPVGTAERLGNRARQLAPAGDMVDVAWNPEFLREGFAVKDTLHLTESFWAWTELHLGDLRKLPERSMRTSRRGHPLSRHGPRDRGTGENVRQRLPCYQDFIHQCDLGSL